MSGATVIGLISDTHGLLRPEALAALTGSDLIIHAGDVGNPEILETLRTIAPIVAVRGNIDRDDWAFRLPLTAIAEANSALIYVLHDIKELDLNPAAGGSGYRSRSPGSICVERPGMSNSSIYHIKTHCHVFD